MEVNMNDELISEFLSYLELDLNYSNNTINSYDNDLKRFENYFKNKNILKLNVNDLLKFVSSLKDLSPASVSALRFSGANFPSAAFWSGVAGVSLRA